MSSVVRFLGLYDFAGTQAAGAYADALTYTLDFGVNRTQVNIPAPLGHVVGVADVISKLRPSAADITCMCHD